MNTVFPPWPLLSAFLLASLVLAVTPGPAVLYILARSVVQGRRSGLVSVAGVALGNLCNALAAAIGLAALFAVSSFAFTLIKYAGALYLVYLGIQMWRAAPGESPVLVKEAPRLRRVFTDGFIVALLNPKTTIFFAAFLPQFMTPEHSHAFQATALGASFVAIAAFTDSAYVLLAGAIAPAFHSAAGRRRIARICGGGTFVGLGVFTMFAGSRSA